MIRTILMALVLASVPSGAVRAGDVPMTGADIQATLSGATYAGVRKGKP